MCKKLKGCGRRIDPCMKNLIEFINDHSNLITVLACCCGHFKYNMIIVVKTNDGEIFDLMSNIEIPRKKKFYKKDGDGYYYIPEVSKEK